MKYEDNDYKKDLITNDKNINKKVEAIEKFLLFIIVFMFFILQLTLFNPVTAIKCNKQSNVCKITQNFVTSYQHQLIDEKSGAVLISCGENTTGSRARYYNIIVKENMGYYDYPPGYYYRDVKTISLTDNNFECSNLNKAFSNYINNETQNIFEKMLVPFSIISFLILLIIVIFCPIEISVLLIIFMCAYMICPK